MKQLNPFLTRRSIRSFSSKPVDRDTITAILNCSQKAPSGFNLQPWHFVIVDDTSVKERLFPLAMNQKQILSAPVIAIFLTDTRCWKTDYQEILRLSERAGSLSEDAVKRYRRLVPMYYAGGPMGLFNFGRRLLAPLRRLLRPTPALPCSSSQLRATLREYTMLAAANYMNAACALGLHTNPMQGFDENRVKKLLNIPRHLSVTLLLPTGYAADSELNKPESVRLPLEDKLHWNSFHL